MSTADDGARPAHAEHDTSDGIWLRPWADGDLWLLRQANSAEMTRFLVAPESEPQLEARQDRYLRLGREGLARMFVVMSGAEPVGGIGWWVTEWQGAPVAETGWFILPGCQGRGIGHRAVQLIVDDAREHSELGLLTAFPAVANLASNALCRRAGFTLRGRGRYPFRGVELEVNDWALELAVPANAIPSRPEA